MNELLEQVHKCVKCGTCMAQCPVYIETLEEPLVARGKISLIENLGDGEGDYNKRLSKILSQCLLCGTCAENCPNGVPADEIIRDARSLLVKERGLSLPKKAIFQHLLDSTYLMPMLLMPSYPGTLLEAACRAAVRRRRPRSSTASADTQNRPLMDTPKPATTGR